MINSEKQISILPKGRLRGKWYNCIHRGSTKRKTFRGVATAKSAIPKTEPRSQAVTRCVRMTMLMIWLIAWFMKETQVGHQEESPTELLMGVSFLPSRLATTRSEVPAAAKPIRAMKAKARAIFCILSFVFTKRLCNPFADSKRRRNFPRNGGSAIHPSKMLKTLRLRCIG
jgi:hypothetical protein